MTRAVKEPSALGAALDERERLVDSLTDQVVIDVESLFKGVVDEAYEAGFEAGELQGRSDLQAEIDKCDAVDALIATVKDFQARKAAFIPLYTWHVGGYFYDSLIRFLEEGVLPPEWQP